MWQYVVEEMNILTTVFLGDFNAKVWYPNAVLATKPITNYYRSPDMGDVFEFFVDATTTAEKIGRLKEAIGRWVFQSQPARFISSEKNATNSVESKNIIQYRAAKSKPFNV